MEGILGVFAVLFSLAVVVVVGILLVLYLLEVVSILEETVPYLGKVVRRLLQGLGVLLLSLFLFGAIALPVMLLFVFSFPLWALIVILGWAERKLGWVVEIPWADDPESYLGRPFSSRF